MQQLEVTYSMATTLYLKGVINARMYRVFINDLKEDPIYQLTCVVIASNYISATIPKRRPTKHI